MTFTIGENVGAYRIVEQLGQGGMATVYKAYHAALDRYVAIKVLHAAFKEEANFLARFQREARVVAKLEHPNIVPVYDYAEHNGSPYLVMKFIEGETLKARLARGPLSPGETGRIVEAVGAGLDYAHRQGILHRDIKPSNVMLARDGAIYLADFGLARIAMAGESTLSTDSMLGTPHYMSPEQAKGVKDLDAGTDIYSLGVVLYELMVGRVPYSADTPFAIIHDHIFTPLPMPRVVNPTVSEGMERVLLKALAKERADRYPDVAALIKAFLAACSPIMAAAPTLVTAMPESTLAGPAGGATVVVSAPPAQPEATVVAAFPAAAAGKAAPAPQSAPKGAQKFPWLWVGLGGLALVVVVGVLGLGLIVGANAQKRRATATAQAQNTAAAVALATQAAATQTVAGLTAVAPPAQKPAPSAQTPVAPPTEPPLPPGVLYFNNFDEGKIPGWKLDPGWGVIDGALCGKGHQWANFLKDTWRDYREAFRLRLEQGQLHVNYRVRSDPFSRYFAVFDPKMVLLAKQEGDKFNDSLRSRPFVFSPGEWYYVEVLGQGPRIMVTVNKETVLDFTDVAPIPEGGISFETLDNTTACLDDVEINALNDPLPPPAETPLPPAAGGGDPMAMITAAGQLFDNKAMEKGWVVLEEAVALDPQNPKVLLLAGDTALGHGAELAQRALNHYYFLALKIERDRPDDLARPVAEHTLLAMYAMATDPDGEKYFAALAQNFQPAEWPQTAKARWDLFAPNADLHAVQKEVTDLMAAYPHNQVLYLIRGDLNLRQKQPVRAGQDYNAAMKNWTKDMPAWVLAEAQCKVKALQENRLNANMEIACVPLSSLVTGK
jgi:tRNA A-37 threonylcarbamoyl transferase component Bud32